MTREALLVLLEMLVKRQMILAIYVQAPKYGNIRDFRRHPTSSDIVLERENWAINPATMTANGEKQRFTFTDRGPKAVGYVLAFKDTGVVIEHKGFLEPYPINSSDDSISITPRIRLTKPGG